MSEITNFNKAEIIVKIANIASFSTLFLLSFYVFLFVSGAARAAYDADGYYYNSSGSATYTTTTTLSVSPSNSTYGETVSLSLTLTGQKACTCGPVTFVVDGSDYATSGYITTSDSYSQTVEISDFPAGTHSVYAEFRPTGVNKESHSATYTITVSKADTTTTITVSDAGVSYGESTTLTASVARADSSITGGDDPSGSVTFYDASGEIGTASLSSGTASLSTSSLTKGIHSVYAVYNEDGGDSNYNDSTSSSTSITVSQAATSMTLSAASSTTTYGTTASITATVSASGGSSLTPSGSVSFRDDVSGSIIDLVTLSSGQATLNWAWLSVGTHNITATFIDADSNFGISTQSITVTVTLSDASITASASPSTIDYGESTTVTANVATVTGLSAPTGSITFSEGGTTFGTATLSGGSASLAISSLSVGSHTITVSYGGNSYYDAASTTATVTVDKSSLPEITSLTPDSGPVTGGTEVVISGSELATVSSVTFGGVAVSKLTVNSDSQVTVVTPAHQKGTVTVTIVNDFGSASLNAAYSYDDLDPTQDSTVRSIIRHQVQSVVDFGDNQMDSVQDRMMTLNECDMNAARKADQGNGDAGSDGFCDLPDYDGGVTLTAPDGNSDLTTTSTTQSGRIPALIGSKQSVKDRVANSWIDATSLHPKFWTSGTVTYGKDSSDEKSFHFTTTGVNLGADVKVSGRARMGVAIGFGNDRASIDDDGSSTRSQLYSAQLYSTYRLMNNSFIGLSGGYAGGTIWSKRYDSNADSIARGNRNSDSLFASVSLNHVMPFNHFQLTSYVKANIQKLWLDQYSESGAGSNNLSYNKMDATMPSLWVGGKLAYQTIDTPLGKLSSSINFRYSHIFDASYKQGMYWSTLPDTTYSLSDSITGQHQGRVGLQLSLKASEHVATNLGYEFAASEDSQSHSVKASFTYGF